MKRIMVAFLLLFSMISNGVCALETESSGISISIVDNSSSKVLSYTINGKSYSFEEAKKIYDVALYTKLDIDNITYYFYKGYQINESEYNDGVDNSFANDLVKQYGEYGIRVHSTDEIIKTVNNLYNNYKRGVFYLVYSTKEYNSFDFNYINDYLDKNYIVDKNKNVFTYNEHALFKYPRLPYNYDEHEMVVFIEPIISKLEQEKVSEFLNEFNVLFKDKTNYEKIRIAYTYLVNTIVKDTNCTGNQSDFNISAYKALIEKKASCIGYANTFQLIMENLNIESYIVENGTYNNSSVIIDHTFNVVKLDDKFYIIDLSLGGYSGFLMGNTNNYVLSNGIELSRDSYSGNMIDINIDYKKFDKIIENIKNDIKKHESLELRKENLKEVDFISFFILIGILLIITVIIIYFTRKGR